MATRITCSRKAVRARDPRIPSSAGVPKDFTKHTVIVPSNDIEAIETCLKSMAMKIAAVLVEPVGGNYGVLPPDIAFLKKLRSITAKYGSLLILMR